MPLSRLLLIMIAVMMFAACADNTPAKTAGTSAETSQSLLHQTLSAELSRALSSEISGKYKDLQVSITDNKVKIGDSLSLEASITNRIVHPDAILLELNIVASHPVLFAGGISDFLAGVGTSDTMAIRTGVESYVAGVFTTILHGLVTEHQPALDFTINKELWHPVTGALQLQGAFSKDTTLDDHQIFKLLKPVLANKLATSTDTVLHWVKAYVSKQADGAITGQCEYDNNPFPEGTVLLKRYAEGWNVKGFAGQKQFIMIRRCGKH